jgi:hypothetical protein
MFEKIVKEMVWVRVRSMFKAYVDQYITNLPTHAERKAFIQLLNNNDEFTDQILNNIWEQFEEDELGEEKIQQITNEVLDFMNKSAEI